MNLSLYKLQKTLKSNKSAQGSLVGVILASVVGTVIVGSLTQWYLSMHQNIGGLNDRLEVMSIATSEWQRLEHMSFNELEASKEKFKTPYQVGNYKVSVNLGNKGYFSNGKCGTSIPSGKYANCFQDTTMTIYNSSGEKEYTTRTLPLMAGLYTREEIDKKFAAVDEKMEGYVKNESYDPKTKTNKVSVKYEKNALTGDYMLSDYIDGKLIENSSNVAILYPRGSKTSPGILHAEEWVEIPNPFPGFYVSVEVHIYVAGRWTPPGYARISTYHREGTVTLQKDANTIVVWAREDVACTCGGYLPNEYTNLQSAPFRVIVTKLGKYEL
ncbi:MAG: hypothetical protein K5983_06960 [Lactobacillus sp.]|nr:hypothetical protein [Lactobacillus sp.]